jgi:glutamate synthase domain-containing protein 2
VPCATVLSERRNRPGVFQPASIVSISAMSFGSLSSAAVVALDRGAVMADCLPNTGEGGISVHHRHGGDLVFQLATGYFGARDHDDGFSIDRVLESMDGAPVKAIEIKLSQGAKPGLGGVLPSNKATPRDRHRRRRRGRRHRAQPSPPPSVR